MPHPSQVRLEPKAKQVRDRDPCKSKPTPGELFRTRANWLDFKVAWSIFLAPAHSGTKLSLELSRLREIGAGKAVASYEMRSCGPASGIDRDGVQAIASGCLWSLVGAGGRRGRRCNFGVAHSFLLVGVQVFIQRL
jgi:hypothetical protein